MLELSIIIVNWNTRDLLAGCLQSVYDTLHGSDFEVFVVDNASTDDSAAMVRERFPAVRLIKNQNNIGFAGANNQAIQKSRGRYVLLLNPDTEVKSRALEMLRSFMEDHPQIGAAGARLLNPDGTLQPSCYPAPTLSRELWRLFHLDALWPYARYDMGDWDLDTPREVDMVKGACVMLRREAMDEVGLLDGDYFMYSEEMDLCYRLRKHDWKVYWAPQAVVTHYGGQSTQQVAGEMFLRLYQSKILYFRKHYGSQAARAYKLILLAAATVRLMVSPLAWLEGPDKRRKHLTLASHYWRLVKALPWL